MTRDELQSIKDYARKLGLFVKDYSWSSDYMFSIKYSSKHTFSTLLDATYSDQNLIGMPQRFTFRYYTLSGTDYNKKVYNIQNISLNFVKKKLEYYASAPKRYAEHLKIKELNNDFK